MAGLPGPHLCPSSQTPGGAGRGAGWRAAGAGARAGGGREVTFRVETGIEYGIFRLKNDDIILAVYDGYKENAAFENGSDEVNFKNVDNLLEYKLNGIPLKQVLL